MSQGTATYVTMKGRCVERLTCVLRRSYPFGEDLRYVEVTVSSRDDIPGMQ